MIIPKDGIETIEKPTIIFDRMCYHKIMHYVEKSSDEVSGFGKVTRNDKGDFVVNDVILLPQKNGSSHTDIEAEDVCKAMYELRDTPGDLNFWWHSHVNMGTFWSGQDKETIQLLGGGGWFLATVFNKKYEQRNAFYVRSKYGDGPKDELRIFIDDIPHKIVTYLQRDTLDKWDAEYEKNVQKRVYPSYGSHWDADREPTQYEINNGYKWVYEKNDWWKYFLSQAGKVISCVKDEPSWVKKDREDEKKLSLIPSHKATVDEDDAGKKDREINEAIERLYGEGLGFY